MTKNDIVFTEKYLSELKQLRDTADYYPLLICRAWHGGKFGLPGHGSADFVASQLHLARIAVRAICT